MYKFKYGGKRGKTIKLVESSDKVVIRTKANKKLDEVKVSRSSKEMLNASEEIISFPEAGISVRQVNADTTAQQVDLRDDTRAALKTEDEIRFAGRVLEDAKTGEVMLYTENFFIKFKDSVPEEKCLQILKDQCLTIKNTLPFAPNSYFVQAEEGTGLKVFEMAEAILKIKEVEYCNPEMVQERRYKAIHPLQWHILKTQINGNTINQHVHIEEAWKVTKGKGITIAIVDDGVDVTHPEFAGRIVAPRDVTAGNDDASPKDPEDIHGTACAGVACAAGLPDGASGTAPESNLMPIRLRSGLGSMAEAMAFAWAADKGADVISCSWGPTDGKWWDPEDALHTRPVVLPDSTRLAIEYALKKGRNGKGCVILFASGNGNEDTDMDGYSSYEGIISVAASNDTGVRSVYSDYGKQVWVNFPSGDYGHRPFKHPAPLTTGIRTTDRMGELGFEKTNYNDRFNGTSSACPGMAGVVALMLAANPALTYKEVKELIKDSTDKIDTANGEYDTKGHSEYYGYGRIHAGKAVANALKLNKATATTAANTSSGSSSVPGASAPTTNNPAVKTALSGIVRFAGLKKAVTLKDNTLYKTDSRKKKILGLSVSSPVKDLMVLPKLNISSRGVIKATKDKEYIGVDNPLHFVSGMAIELSGAAAADYDIEYSVQLQGEIKARTGKNGSFVGSAAGKEKPVEAFSVRLVRKKNGI